MSTVNWIDKDTPYDIRIVHIDSKFRNQNFKNPNKFTYQLLTPLKNVLYAKIIFANIPATKFTITKYNNGFVLCEDETNYPIELPVGDYDTDKLICTLVELLNSQGAQNAYSVKIENGKLLIQGSADPPVEFQLKFAPPAQYSDQYVYSNGETNTEVMLNQSIRTIMGFCIEDYTSVPNTEDPTIFEILSPNKIDLVGDKEVYIYIKTDGGHEFNLIESINQNLNNCFCVVPLDAPRNTIVYYKNQFNQRKVFYTPLKKLEKMFIELRGCDYRDLYNTCGVNWSMAIEFGIAL